MLFNYLKSFFKYLLYKKLYSDSNIALGSQVGNNSILGKNTEIGRKTSVFKSNLGDNVIIHENCHVDNSTLDRNNVIASNCRLSNVTLGRFSYIASNSSLSLTKIGNFCSVGPDLICGYGEHPSDFISTNPVFFSTLKQCGVSFSNKNYFEEKKEITIGHDVWIGARVFIRDGVRIGNGAIIGAGAVVVSDVPDYAIVGGVPAKIIRYRFSEDLIREILKIQWWNWSEEKLRKAQVYFVCKDIHSFIQWASGECVDMASPRLSINSSQVLPSVIQQSRVDTEQKYLHSFTE